MSLAWIEPDWPAPRGVRAASTFRAGGVSEAPYASLNLGGHVGDRPAAVAENRLRLRRALGLPAEPEWLAQVHGVGVADLDAVLADAPRRADACTTRQAGRVCAILTADCLPLLLPSDSADRVGAAHAGWRGLAGGVIEAAVRALGAPPSEILAWLGPAIGPAHFEVGPEVREELLIADPGASEAFSLNARGRFMANLPQLARRRLAALGISRIYAPPECTHGDAGRYFSHRRDGPTGRQATLIWRE
jgi:YfiH family protein